MKLAFLVIALALVAGAAQAADTAGLAIADPGLKAARTLTVSSPAFAAGGAIPDKYTSYGASISPPLAWRGAPAAAKSFAIVLEDPDAPTPVPFQHWLAWNLPAGTRQITEGALPAGARQGTLMMLNRAAYFGPRPPAGPAHHYHFQVFALDGPLDLDSGASRATLVDAMKGHVLAAGELVATYQKK